MECSFYIAIIGDFKQSRKIVNRNEVQKKLKVILEEINKKYVYDLASKFIITLGDEFQGLLRKGKNTLNIISEIERKMYPVQIRFGVGIGSITTEINMERSFEMDGPGYHMARNAITYLKTKEKSKETNAADVRFEADGVNNSVIVLLNAVLSLMTVMKESWSERQREIIWDKLEYQDSQMCEAERLGIKQPAVQKSLSKGKYYAYKDALDSVEKVLEIIGREDV